MEVRKINKEKSSISIGLMLLLCRENILKMAEYLFVNHAICCLLAQSKMAAVSPLSD